MELQIVEVGPRDGLQNESTLLDTPAKLDLIGRLVAAGATRIEVASFVHPRLVPQMADAEAVCEGLPEDDSVSYIGLVLNRKGLDRALLTRVDEVNFVVGATESFTRENQGAGVEETLADIEAMLPRASGAGRHTSVTISVAFGCPYEGEVDTRRVVDIARRAAAAGADEIAFGDTIGAAVPADVTRVVDAVRRWLPAETLRCHFHDTRRTGVANAQAAYAVGVGVLDASIGGTGGCPFAPNATGNVATEDLWYLFERSGIPTGLSIEDLLETSHWLGGVLGKPPEAGLARAGVFPT